MSAPAADGLDAVLGMLDGLSEVAQQAAAVTTRTAAVARGAKMMAEDPSARAAAACTVAARLARAAGMNRDAFLALADGAWK